MTFKTQLDKQAYWRTTILLKLLVILFPAAQEIQQLVESIRYPRGAGEAQAH